MKRRVMKGVQKKKAEPGWTELVDDIQARRDRFKLGSRAWMAAYHVSLFGAALLSALAALVLKVPDKPSADLATVFATVAALLTTLSSVGSFQRKWTANRDAWCALDLLLIDIAYSDIDQDRARERFVRVVRRQQRAWVEAGDEEAEQPVKQE